MDRPSQNAFVSGQPKKIFAHRRNTDGDKISRHGWVVPMQRKNREKSGHIPASATTTRGEDKAAGSDNQGGTTGV
jgi:hypothetical protein